MDGKFFSLKVAKVKVANLKMQRGCQWWYGRYKLHGKDTLISLRIEIAGKRPARLKDAGDLEFERSRIKAQLKMDQFLADLNTRKSKEKLAKEIYKIQSGGEEFPEYEIKDMFKLWCSMSAHADRSDRRVSNCKTWITRFINFMVKEFPKIKFSYQMTEKHALAYMKSVEGKGFAPKTYNGILKLMRCCLREADSKVFDKISLRKGKTIHRVPYTLEELKTIRRESKTDEFIRPVIIIAMCTGMRLGDCCTLKWSAIDDEEGIIRVKTIKTEATVVVPLFDWLKDELELQRKLSDSDYVLPKQRWKYMADSSFFTRQLRKVLVKSGFGKAANSCRGSARGVDVDIDSVCTKVHAYIKSLPPSRRVTRMQKVFSLYINGKSIDQVSEEVGVSKSTSSAYLNELEDSVKSFFIRGKCRVLPEIDDTCKPVQIEREVGQRRASIRDFHGFRTTWVTLALKAGVPIETVKLVTGHKTVEIVIENYFNPAQRDIRDMLKDVMPFSDSLEGVA